jgi:platelet-activating factor acetylhydrolase IB subunit beta/gamma
MGDMDLTETGLQKSDAQAYARVVKCLRDELPNAKIIITAFFIQRGFGETVIEEANQMLRAIANENGDAVSFLPFGDDQTEIMSDDQIHPNNDGYRKWCDLLKDDMKSH